MDGLQLTADLHACDPAAPVMRDAGALRTLCLHAVRDSGLAAVGELFHAFAPPPSGAAAGITGVVLLAESHLAVHTWPELGAVTLDVYVCNFGSDNSQRAAQLMERVVQAFAPGSVQRRELRRGGNAS